MIASELKGSIEGDPVSQVSFLVPLEPIAFQDRPITVEITDNIAPAMDSCGSCASCMDLGNIALIGE